MFFRKIYSTLIFSLMLCFILSFLAQASQAEGCNPLQVSLAPSVQLVPKGNGICGIRLNLMWGENTSVNGIDAGLLNVAESLKGVEIGGINWLSGDENKESWGIQAAAVNRLGKVNYTGAQIALVFNSNDSEVNGLQLAPFNFGWKNSKTNGMQIGVMNFASEVHGFQLAISNVVWGKMDGAQISIYVNEVDDQMQGVQIALGNGVKHDVLGAQIGFLNMSYGNVKGGQIGIINISKYLTGFQLGLINVVYGGVDAIPFFPIINVGWH